MSARSRSVRAFGGVATLTVALAACSSGPAVTTGPTASLATPNVVTPGPTLAPSHAIAKGQIVFVDEQGASTHAQLYVERADGTDVHRLVTSEFDDRGPALSPDGRRVAFTRYAPEGSPDGGVFVVNIDGTGLSRVDTLGEDVSWSPDGTKLVETRGSFDPAAVGPPYTEPPINVSLWIENADGSGAHQITLIGLRCKSDGCTGGAPGEAGAPGTPGAQDNEPRWSPDGTRIAFLRDTYTSPEQYSVFTVAIDGSDLRRVTPANMEVGNPHWSPDGTWIAFQSPKEPVKSGEQNVYKIHPDGSGMIALTAHLTSDPTGVQGTFHPCWSPDGSQLVFSHYPGSSAGVGSLYLMNADGGDPHLLASSNLNANAAEWGPLPTSG